MYTLVLPEIDSLITHEKDFCGLIDNKNKKKLLKESNIPVIIINPIFADEIAENKDLLVNESEQSSSLTTKEESKFKIFYFFF